MGTSASLPIMSLPSPFPFSPESSPRPSLKPCPPNPPCRLPFPFSSLTSPNPSTIPHQLPSNPFRKPFSSPILPKTTPFPSLHSDVFPGSVEAVICPSLAYANVYFYNVQVVPLDDEETLYRLNDRQNELLADRMVKRFRNAVANAGVFYEMKRRRFFENPRAKKKTKAQRAAKLLKRARIRAGRGLLRPKISIRRDPLEEKRRKARLAAKRPKKQKPKNTSNKEKKESYISDDDNWEFEDVELPYC